MSSSRCELFFYVAGRGSSEEAAERKKRGGAGDEPNSLLNEQTIYSFALFSLSLSLSICIPRTLAHCSADLTLILWFLAASCLKLWSADARFLPLIAPLTFFSSSSSSIAYFLPFLSFFLSVSLSNKRARRLGGESAVRVSPR